MSRLVQPASLLSVEPDILASVQSLSGTSKGVDLGGVLKRAVQKEEKGDSYATRVAKYIPGEILAAYVAMLGIIETVGDAQLKKWLFLAALVLCAVFTPIYFIKAAEDGEPRTVHVVVSSLAFLVWAYSLDGYFGVMEIYHAAVGSFLLIVFTLASGAIVPQPGKK